MDGFRGVFFAALAAGLQLPAGVRAQQAPSTFVSALQAALHDDTSYRVRLQAAVLLGRTRDADACAPLVQALTEDPHLAVRAGAAMALGALQDGQSLVPLCEQAARDPEALVRREALQALDAFSTGDVVAALRRVYSRLPATLRAPLLQRLAAAAGDAGNPRLQRAATRILKEAHEVRRPG